MHDYGFSHCFLIASDLPAVTNIQETDLINYSNQNKNIIKSWLKKLIPMKPKRDLSKRNKILWKGLVKDLDVPGNEDKDDTFSNKIWEGLAGAIGQHLKNQSQDQLAIKPFEGNVKGQNTYVWSAIANILNNIFIQALQPSVDHEISITYVSKPKEEKKNIIQKIIRINFKEHIPMLDIKIR
jgi:hypothetical protein